MRNSALYLFLSLSHSATQSVPLSLKKKQQKKQTQHLPLLARPICPSFGGLFACDEAKKALVSCSPQLKDIWLTSLSAP